MIAKQSSPQADHPPSAAAVTVEALGQSEAFLDFQERLSRVAPIDRSVLLVGERGTGKELAAARLHYLSGRWQGPFVSLNCAALVSTLIESELFGHEKGAFTGAQQRKTGRFEAADGGTLFLDEIGLIPIQAQEKVLRVVEYGSFERVGSSASVEVDVRIIGATNMTCRPWLKKAGLKKISWTDSHLRSFSCPRSESARGISSCWPVTSPSAWPMSWGAPRPRNSALRPWTCLKTTAGKGISGN